MNPKLWSGMHLTHESRWICLVSPDLAINHNLALHQDWNNFTIGQSILQPVPEDKDQRQALPGFVGTRWRLGCLLNRKRNKIWLSTTEAVTSKWLKNLRQTYKCSTKLVKHPMLRSIEPLQMFLQTPRLYKTIRKLINITSTKMMFSLAEGDNMHMHKQKRGGHKMLHLE